MLHSDFKVVWLYWGTNVLSITAQFILLLQLHFFTIKPLAQHSAEVVFDTVGSYQAKWILLVWFNWLSEISKWFDRTVKTLYCISRQVCQQWEAEIWRPLWYQLCNKLYLYQYRCAVPRNCSLTSPLVSTIQLPPSLQNSLGVWAIARLMVMVTILQNDPFGRNTPVSERIQITGGLSQLETWGTVFS